MRMRRAATSASSSLAHGVELSRPDIGVPGELAHLEQRGAVADGVVDGGLAERMDADAPAAQPVGVEARAWLERIGNGQGALRNSPG